MSNSSIWPIDRTLSGATTQGQSGPGSDGNEGVLHIRQSSNITEASSSDFFVSYPEGESYPSAEMQSPPVWADRFTSYIALWMLPIVTLTYYHSLFTRYLLPFTHHFLPLTFFTNLFIHSLSQ